MSALWELAPPVFLGTLLAIVAVMMLMGRHRKLMRGPRMLAAWLYGDSRCSGRSGCMCAGCGGGAMGGWMKGGWKNKGGWKKDGGWKNKMMKEGAAGGCPMMRQKMMMMK